VTLFAAKPRVRNENDFVAALGQPLLAARPLRRETHRARVEQLLAYWFSRQRLLPIVSTARGEGRTRLALELARGIAALGVRTLLVDGDLRSPRLHQAFRLPNRHGLADFLAGREVQLTQCGENLALLAAGRSPGDPLEALASPRLPPLLRVAATRFGAIIIDTPAARRGPDLKIFAALAGGALVIARQCGADARALGRLRRNLHESSAQVVGILLRQ
jgi:Mrp family chromosome partitioning ATPase